MPVWEITRNGKVVGEIESDQPPDRRTVMRALSELDKQSVLPAQQSQPSVMPDAEWEQLPVADKVKNALTYGGNALADMMGFRQGFREAVEHPTATLATAAVPMAVSAAGKAVLPNMARAGEKFQKVMAATKKVPLETGATGQSVYRATELAERGGTMPKAVRDLFKRLTDPEKGDLNYEEARDFYRNISRLSADETKRLTPVMRRQVGQIRADLNSALEGAAAKTGNAGNYKSAMKEYSRAARLRDFGEKVKKYALPAGVGLGVAHYGIDKASELVSGR